MKASAFKKLLEQVLRSTVGQDRFTEVIEQARPAPACCPACGRRDVIDTAGRMACSVTAAWLAAGPSPH